MKTVIMLVLIAGLIACTAERRPEKHGMKTYAAKLESVHKSLHFTGIIAPLRESSIVSPMDAVIETMPYRYGQMVAKDEVVMTLNSSELQRQYNETLTEYLKAKDSFSVARSKFTGTQNLWDAGLMSKNNFLSEKSSLDTARVTLMQSTRKLTEMLEKMDESDKESLSRLSIAEFDKVRQILTARHNLIRLKAPFAGVLLYPPKAGNEDKSGQLTVGSSVKAGQVLALTGDLNGLRVEIDVSEIDIGKIHPGMKANISGVALGKEVIRGELTVVNSQATPASGNNALPTFTALVEVHSLTDRQKQLIKAGMSAAIELAVEEEKQLLIPIAAVMLEHGESVVMVRGADGKLSRRRVITGAADVDKVVIESGLNNGDVVVYDE